jgi:uncharacterized repeat protein (TIGR01451 family)
MESKRFSFGITFLKLGLVVILAVVSSVTVGQAGSLLPASPNWSASVDQEVAYLGWTVAAAGDVNHDGYGDVLASAINYDHPEAEEGLVQLYLGGAGGLADSPAWSVESDKAYALLGTAVVNAGDTDLDGFEDMLVTARDYGRHVQGGAAFLYPGTASGLSSTPSWSVIEPLTDARFGASAAAGDVNGDGYADVIIGAPYYRTNPTEPQETYSGKAYVYYGSKTGLSDTPGWQVTGDQDWGLFGYAVTACDVNHDAFSDVIVSAIDYDHGQSNEGRVFIYFGAADGAETTAFWTVEPDVAESDFGIALSCGDVNRDTRPDLVVGAQTYSSGEANEGAVFVYYGVGPDGPFPGEVQVIQGSVANAHFGAAVDASGDLDFDGYKDLAVGAPYYSTTGLAEEGRLSVYRGAAGGLETPAAWTGEVGQAYGYLGSSVAWAGDVNGDGSSDLLGGAPYYDADGLSDTGAVFAWYGFPPGSADLALQKTASAAAVRIGGNVNFTLKPTNLGPADAGEVQVQDVLPAGLSFQEAGGEGWDCSQAGGTVTCTRPSLPPGAGPELLIKTTVTAPSGTLHNTAAISSKTTEPVPGNNTAEAAVQVTPLKLQLVRRIPAAIENAPPQPFTVTLEAASPLTVTVNYATADGTATYKEDYQSGFGTLTFPPGATTRTFLVDLLDDDLYESPTETFTVSLTTPVNAALGTPSSRRFTIYENEAPPVVQFIQNTFQGEEGDIPVTSTVRLSTPAGAEVRVRCATYTNYQGHYATPDQDYLPLDTTLVFPPGDTQADCAVRMLDDQAVEPGEAFMAQLSDPVNAVLGSQSLVPVTILDNDVPVIRLSQPTFTFTEGSAAKSLWLEADEHLANMAHLNYRLSGGTARGGLDFVPAQGTIDLVPDEYSRQYRVTVELLDDDSDEADETFFVEFSSPQGVRFDPAEVYGGASPFHPPVLRATVVISDNDLSAEAYDLVSGPLEVTQGVQDLKGSVRLVSGRSTYVRFHPRSASVDFDAAAQLQVRHYDTRSGQWSTDVLEPKNSGGRMTVRQTPDRVNLDQSFWFEIPTEWTRSGSIDLTAVVNPDRSVWEDNYDNNSTSGTYYFESVPALHVAWYRVGFCLNYDRWWERCNESVPGENIFDSLWNATYSAFPLESLETERRHTRLPRAVGEPNFDEVVAELMRIKLQNLPTGMDGDHDTLLKMHYYGVFNEIAATDQDGLGFIPGMVACGDDTGLNRLTVAHELGHNFNRMHTNCNGREADPDPNYPYPDGRLSPTSTLTAANALFGFNILDKSVIPPGNGDLMSYCADRWPGDYTYEALLDFLHNPFYLPLPDAQAAAPGISQPAGQPVSPELPSAAWAVSGQITPTGAALDPLFALPGGAVSALPAPGDYSLVVKNSAGAELARYPFAPLQLEDSSTLFVSVLIPQSGQAGRLELAGPSGALLAAIQAGMAPPTLTLTAPAFPDGPQMLVGEAVTLTWSASDPDGDPLTYQVYFSPDDGVTWNLLSSGLQETSITLPVADLSQATPGRLVVQASDGIHTAFAQTDAFYVANRPPEAAILSPTAGTALAVNQTLELHGLAYDPDSGDLPAEKVQWFSDRDGLLGSGANLSVSGLRVGTHQITLQAGGSAGGQSWAVTRVDVLPRPDLVPPPEDALQLSPASLDFSLPSAPLAQTFWVDNANPADPLTWTAQASQTWLKLSLASGLTPARVTASLDLRYLPAGMQTAVITITSPALPGQAAALQVQAQREANRVYLPYLRH